VASFTSVLRPGTFLMRAALVRNSAIALSHRTWPLVPVDAGRFHDNVGAALGRQPFRQRHQFLGRRLEHPNRPLYRSPHHVADTVQDRVLANIQTGAMRIQIQSGMLKASGSD
jgi:hypothetical protein